MSSCIHMSIPNYLAHLAIKNIGSGGATMSHTVTPALRDAMRQAIEHGNDTQACELLDEGFPISLANQMGLGALLLNASIYDVDNLLQALIKHGIYLNFRKNDGDTPLIYTIRHNYYDASAALLEAGAKPNNVGAFGQTALFLAMVSQTEPRLPRLIEQLIEKGADMRNFKAVQGEDLLDLAIDYANHTNLELVLKAGYLDVVDDPVTCINAAIVRANSLDTRFAQTLTNWRDMYLARQAIANLVQVNHHPFAKP